MKISAIKWENEASEWAPDIVDLGFIYFQDSYKIIVNHRGYTLETLMGQVGGFVGNFIYLVYNMTIHKNNDTYNSICRCPNINYALFFIGIFLGYSVLHAVQNMFAGFTKLQTYFRDKVDKLESTTVLQEVVHANSRETQVDGGNWMNATHEI